jgi:hypothetical protein
VTTTRSNITTGMTPVEAATLLDKLQEGQQAAWLATHQAPWHGAEYQARFHNAADVEDVFRDLMWETLENGMRRPGEPVEEFAERAESEDTLAAAGKARAGTAADPVIQPAGAETTPERAGNSQDETTARLTSPGTPECQAYAKAFSDSAPAYVRDLRERDPLPEPDRTPGAPHPDPFLAVRGWRVNEHGIYTRRAGPRPVAPPRPEKELEAG